MLDDIDRLFAPHTNILSIDLIAKKLIVLTRIRIHNIIHPSISTMIENPEIVNPTFSSSDIFFCIMTPPSFTEITLPPCTSLLFISSNPKKEMPSSFENFNPVLNSFILPIVWTT
jgi:hypothetical protein